MPAALTHKEGIADLLLEEGIIDGTQYNKAMAEYERTRSSLVRILVEMGALNERKRLEILQRTLSLSVVNLRDTTPRSDVHGFLSRDVCRRRMVVPLKVEDGAVLVAMEDPSDVRTVSDLEKVFALPIKAVLATDKDILAVIDKLPEGGRPSTSGEHRKPDAQSDASGIATLSLMVLVFAPIVAFYYFVAASDAGKEFYGGLGFSMFENILVFVVVWGSWAAIAYFLNDLVFGRVKE